VEEKHQVEQKYLEDCRRIEQNLADLQNMISAYTAELQSLGDTALKRQPDVTPEALKRTQNDSFTFNLGGNWKIVGYVLGTILMLIVLFFLVSLFEKPKEKAHVSSESPSIAALFPSLVNSAEACVIADRIRERVQERRDAVDSLADAPEEQEVSEEQCADADECAGITKAALKRPVRQPVRILFRSMRR
jgi:hypothetical protein